MTFYIGKCNFEFKDTNTAIFKVIEKETKKENLLQNNKYNRTTHSE